MLLNLKLLRDSKEKAISLLFFLFLFGLSGVLNPDIAASEPSSLPDHIMLSWTDDPQTTRTAAWRSDSAADAEWVQYLPAASYNGSFTSASQVAAVKTELYAGYSHCEATMFQLAPDCEYIYRVGREGVWSEPASFSTTTPGGKFSFLYLGDVQKGYDKWGEMLKHIAAENPDLRFALLGGDLVHDGNSSNEWQQFFAAASPTFKQLPLLPAVGNHDDTPLFWNSFALPRNGPEGFKEEFYSFDYGNCHIAVLNSNKMGVSKPYYNMLKSWLQADLNNSKQQWKFLVFHYPPYPVVDDGHSYNLEENWVPLFEQCTVDIVFVGHQHVYMRSKPLRGDKVQADGEGIVYIMGNSGSKFYPAGEDREYIAKQMANVSNYQLLSIDGDSLSLSSRNAEGQVIDRYILGDVPAARAQYLIAPIKDASYQIETNTDGLEIMTVNQGNSGMKYFRVELTPVKPHEGMETLIFIHLRNGKQLNLNATQADFDLVKAAQAGFNVKPGDIVKTYVLDDLTNALDFNPTILQ